MTESSERLVVTETLIRAMDERLDRLEKLYVDLGPKILRLEVDYVHFTREFSELKKSVEAISAGVQSIQHIVQRVRGGYAVLAAVAAVFTSIGALAMEAVKWLKHP